MDYKDDWKLLLPVVLAVAGMFVFAAVTGDSIGGRTYEAVAHAVPIEPPAAMPSVPQQAYDDALTAQEWTAWAALIGAISGVGSLLILMLTLLTTRDMLNEARKTTDAALKTIQATKEVGQKQIAAYLSVSDLDLAFSAAGTLPRYTASIKNTGNSPAIDIEAVFSIRFSYFDKGEGADEGKEFFRSTVYWFSRALKDLQSGETTKIDWAFFPTTDCEGPPLSAALPSMAVNIGCKVFATDVFGDEVSAFSLATVVEFPAKDDASKNRKVIDTSSYVSSSVNMSKDVAFRSRLRKRRLR